MTLPINTHVQVKAVHWLGGRRGVVSAHRYSNDPGYRGANHNVVRFDDADRPPYVLFLSDRDVEVIEDANAPDPNAA